MQQFYCPGLEMGELCGRFEYLCFLSCRAMRPGMSFSLKTQGETIWKNVLLEDFLISGIHTFFRSYIWAQELLPRLRRWFPILLSFGFKSNQGKGQWHITCNMRLSINVVMKDWFCFLVQDYTASKHRSRPACSTRPLSTIMLDVI